MKYVVVGGVAGGAAVAARLRRNDEHAQIIVFEKGEYISYANCGLPYYVGETIRERENLFLESPESFRKNLNIDVFIKHEVLSIDKIHKQVKVINHVNSNVTTESYDKLILSPGATPVIPPVDGIESSRVFTLRNVPDADRLKDVVDKTKPTSAVIIGGGFIGVEAAESLYNRGINVSIVEMADQIMAPLDYEMAARVHSHLKFKNVALYLKDGIKSFQDHGNRLEITLMSGKKIYTDLAVLSIGVKPLTVLAENAGLEVNRGIVVNEYMETSEKDIFALGDAAEIKNAVTGKNSLTPLAGPAGKQARILADNLVYGKSKIYKGAIGTAIAKIFDMTVASTGLAEKHFSEDVHSVIINGSSHAGYYPGAKQLFLKLVFTKEGKLLGAQGVGYEGVDKRIEMIAAVLRMGGSVTDLTEVEHAYAPPYSSSKDPVNILGFTAENVMLERSHHTSWREFQEILSKKDPDICLVDIRTPDERELHPLPGTINMGKEEIRSRMEELPREKRIILICSGGLRAYLAERTLKQSGFTRVSILSGGTNIYFTAAENQENRLHFDNTAPVRTAPALSPILTEGVIDVDACGLQCPGPILKLKKEMEKIDDHQRLRVKASDSGFYKDVTSWCNMTGNKIINVEQKEGNVIAIVEKSPSLPDTREHEGFTVSSQGNEVTIICFSDDMDRALAALVIANGAAASGKKVTLFFTFWGLSVIKKYKKPRVKKGIPGRMFGFMLPSNNSKLALSKMNMGGIGAFMMKGIMNNLKIDNLQTMLKTVIEGGATLIACQMSMDVMGVKQEELIDEAEIGGVANYLESATTAGINLFI